MLEAKLKLSMGGSATPRERHTVGEVVSGYIADGASRLSPGTVDSDCKGLAALPDAFRERDVADVTPLVLDSVYGELCDEGASEHKIQKVHRLLSAAFNRAVRYGWMVANPCLQATKPKVDSEEIVPPTPEWVEVATMRKNTYDVAVANLAAIVEMERPGDSIRARRTELGMTQAVLAQLSGISQADISRIENGQLDARWSTIRRLSEALESASESPRRSLSNGNRRRRPPAEPATQWRPNGATQPVRRRG